MKREKKEKLDKKKWKEEEEEEEEEELCSTPVSLVVAETLHCGC